MYFHSSNLDYTKYLREYDNFEHLYQYISNCEPTYPNEYGRIKTDQAFYHILLGKISQENCPWCGGKGKLKKREMHSEEHFYFTGFDLVQYYIECIDCGSRGPILMANKGVKDDKEMQDNLESYAKQRYAYRKMWDHDLRTND